MKFLRIHAQRYLVLDCIESLGVIGRDDAVELAIFIRGWDEGHYTYKSFRTFPEAERALTDLAKLIEEQTR